MHRHLACLALVFLVACSGGQTKNPTPPPTNEGDPTPVTNAECTTDADCRIFSDYCTGCDCRALATAEADPVCDGPGVRCVADPCMGRAAVCEAGECTLAAAEAAAP
jgi:hypothetical protein